MKSLNRIIISGYVGQNPKTIKIAEDREFLTFSVAVSRYLKEGDDFKKISDWFNVCVQDKYLVDRLKETLLQGSYVFVEGEVRKYTPKSEEHEPDREPIYQIIVTNKGEVRIQNYKHNDQDETPQKDNKKKSSTNKKTESYKDLEDIDDEILFGDERATMESGSIEDLAVGRF